MFLEHLLISFPFVVTVVIQHSALSPGVDIPHMWFERVLRMLRNPYFKFNTFICADWLFDCRIDRFYFASDFYHLAEFLDTLAPLLNEPDCDHSHFTI